LDFRPIPYWQSSLGSPSVRPKVRPKDRKEFSKDKKSQSEKALFLEQMYYRLTDTSFVMSYIYGLQGYLKWQQSWLRFPLNSHGVWFSASIWAGLQPNLASVAIPTMSY
jgi:hypothetical protein